MAFVINSSLLGAVNFIATIIQLREQVGPDGQQDSGFKSVNELVNAGVNSAVVANLSRYCTVRSSVFKVTVHAEIGGSSRDFYAILFQNGRNVQVVSFYWNK